jgi:hypothetical protein
MCTPHLLMKIRGVGAFLAGAKSVVFEAKLNRVTIRRTLGDVRDWDIPKARKEAQKLAVMIDGGTDPRELERQLEADARARAAAAQIAAEPARAAWERYLTERRPHWRERTHTDHLKVAQEGGGAPGCEAKARRSPALLRLCWRCRWPN